MLSLGYPGEVGNQTRCTEDPWTPWTAFSRLCFSARLFDALRKISDELNAESAELSDGDSWTS